MKTTDRMIGNISAYAAEIQACPYDHRRGKIALLMEQLCEGLAGLAENLTDEDGAAVANCAEFIIEAADVMFDAADQKVEHRREERAA